MKEQYQSEVSQIQASARFKEQLKERMAHGEAPLCAPLPSFKNIVLLCSCLLLIITSLFAYAYLSKPSLPLLTISSNTSNQPSGIGSIGTLGDDASLLKHQNPYTPQENDTLPVFANPHAEENWYLSTQEDEVLLPILEKMAKQFHLEDYTIKHMEKDPDPYMINSNLYLDCAEGKLILYTKTSAYFLLNEETSYDLSGQTQEEVRLKTERFLTQFDWIDFEDPLIDVMLTQHIEGSNRWQILISEEKEEPTDALIEQQLHSFTLTLDSEGMLQSISYQDVDTSDVLGNYPLKSEEEALDALLQGNCISYFSEQVQQYDPIGFWEIVYGTYATNDYYLPYYKFYVLQDVGNTQFYVPYYVIAIQDDYLIAS